MGAGTETAFFDQAAKVLDELNALADELLNAACDRLLKNASSANLVAECTGDEECDPIVMGRSWPGRRERLSQKRELCDGAQSPHHRAHRQRRTAKAAEGDGPTKRAAYGENRAA
ncbi:hypothetical protein [Gordonibacter sp. An230]|uniref:hypothetical protein n=1 Tax=Gordonibacter sp. An230 TaxID=1965592 RepID=UPI00194EA0CD|nr:hypothetical protein [Gordonibacter sp. An230]